MKRTFAAAVAAVTAGTSIALAAPGHAASPGAPAAVTAAVTAAAPAAALRVVPPWTYRYGGKLAVIATCSERHDRRVITASLLRRPVVLPRRGNLLIKLTRRIHTGKYVISLWCVNGHRLVDAVDMKPVRILRYLGTFSQPAPPPLPKHFKPAVTVVAGTGGQHGGSRGGSRGGKQAR